MERWAEYVIENLPAPLKRNTNDDLLTRKIIQGVQSLVDPEVYDLCREIDGETVYLKGYNIAAAAREPIRELLKTNPGIVGWYYNHTAHKPENRRRGLHSGQLVTAVCEELAGYGFDLKNWKFAAALPIPEMAYLARHENPGRAALLLNLMAESRSHASPSILLHVNSTILRLLEIPKFRNPVAERNIRCIVRLLFQESHRLRKTANYHAQQELIDQAVNLSDWAHDQRTHQAPIRVRTWAGCLRNSDRWHRQLNEARNQILEKNNGCLHCWNSLLPIHEEHDFSFHPLSDEIALLQEAVSMNHCVDRYRQACSSGNSRIFSVRKGLVQVANVELVRNGDEWRIGQLRGPRNHSTTPKIQDAVNALLERYKIAWAETPPEERHQSWLAGNEIT